MSTDTRLTSGPTINEAWWLIKRFKLQLWQTVSPALVSLHPRLIILWLIGRGRRLNRDGRMPSNVFLLRIPRRCQYDKFSKGGGDVALLDLDDIGISILCRRLKWGRYRRRRKWKLRIPARRKS